MIKVEQPPEPGEPKDKAPDLIPADPNLDWDHPVQMWNDILLLELIARETFGPRRYQ